MLWLHLIILLACIVVGARFGGMALGPAAGVGLAIFVFGLPPGAPPGTVLGMILAAVTALGLLQAAGGLDWVIGLAERLLRRNPRQITLLAPLVAYALTFASGTQHVIYALLPIIAEVSRSAGVRPERPLSISVIAAQHGLVASPISAATVALVGSVGGLAVRLPEILAVTIPATLLGVAAGTLSVAFRGAELAEDREYQRRLAAGEVAAPAAELPPEQRRRARGACLVFLAAIAGVVLLGLFPDLRPVHSLANGSEDRIAMGQAIMVVMLAAAGVLLVAFQPSPEKALTGSIMKGGITAIVSILGVSWLGSSFFAGHETEIVGGIAEQIRAHPWIFALGLFNRSVPRLA